jgi:transcriptional regulator with XRE-family HTH domain
MTGDTAQVNEGGRRLRSVRIAAGLTQDQLAELARVHVRTIRGLEAGRISRPRRSTVDALAAAIGLGLTGRAELFAAWRIYDPRPATSTVAPTGDGRLDVIEAYLARSRREFRIAAVLEQAVIGTDRRAARRATQEVVVAQQSGVSIRAIHYDPMDETVDLAQFHLEELVNCAVVDEVVDPGGQGKLFTLQLPTPLDAGQTHIARYVADFATIRTAGGPLPKSAAEIAGFFHSPAIYLLEVQFQESDLPIACEQVYQSRPTTSMRTIAPLALSDGRTCHVALVNPRPGGHGIAWRW